MTDRAETITSVEIKSRVLEGKRAFILGIANRDSNAYGCARVFRQLGLRRRYQACDGYLLPFVHPDGAARGALDEGSWRDGSNRQIEAFSRRRSAGSHEDNFPPGHGRNDRERSAP
jgi:enoyl-[acyl-carrier protein] reductase I